MNDRQSPDSGPHRAIPPGEEEHTRELDFEKLLMEKMGVPKHDNDAALAWVDRYAKAYRVLVDSDAGLRDLIAKEPTRAVEDVRRRLTEGATEKRTA